MSYLIDVICFLPCLKLIIKSSNNVSYTESEENCPEGTYLLIEVFFFISRLNLCYLLFQIVYQPEDTEKKKSSHEIECIAKYNRPVCLEITTLTFV